MKINRCICNNVTFAEYLEICKAKGITDFEDSLTCIPVCNQCKMCEPYLQLTIETGVIEFDYIIRKQQ